MEPQRAARRYGLSALERLRRGAGIALVCTAPVACGKLLGLEPARRAGSDRGGAAGSAGDGGEGMGAGLGGTAGRGGTSGASGAGTSGASTSGGTGGTTSSGGSTGAGEGGAAGAGGEPLDPGPTLGAECETFDAKACSPWNWNIVLTCGGPEPTEPLVWRISTVCPQNQRCDRETLACEVLEDRCIDTGVSLCAESVLYDCETDPPATVVRRCPFGCEKGHCLSGVDDQLIVHTETNLPNDGPWTGAIGVCFDAGTAHPVLSAWTRDELERSWSRYLAVDFEGFDVCPEEPTTGVRVEFLRDCRQRLGSAFPSGSPGGGAERRIGICESYRDASDERRFMSDHETLFRYVVRHEFGHVLGSPDDFLNPSNSMTPWLRESRVDEFGLAANDLLRLFSSYGKKPFRSLVTTSGYCLAPSSDGIRPAVCPESGAASFVFRDGEAATSGGAASGCLVVGQPGEPVTVGACGSSAPLLNFTRARWSTPKTCIAARHRDALGPARGSSIETGPCAPVGDASEAWNFELRTSDATVISTRIRASASGDCLSMTNIAPVRGDVPLLRACSNGTALQQEVFLLWPDGRISFGSEDPPGLGALCLDFQGDAGTVSLGNCDKRYFLSGPLETPNGLALQITPNDTNSRLAAVLLEPSAPLSPHQVFDFSF